MTKLLKLLIFLPTLSLAATNIKKTYLLDTEIKFKDKTSVMEAASEVLIEEDFSQWIEVAKLKKGLSVEAKPLEISPNKVEIKYRVIDRKNKNKEIIGPKIVNKIGKAAKIQMDDGLYSISIQSKASEF